MPLVSILVKSVRCGSHLVLDLMIQLDSLRVFRNCRSCILIILLRLGFTALLRSTAIDLIVEGLLTPLLNLRGFIGSILQLLPREEPLK